MEKLDAVEFWTLKNRRIKYDMIQIFEIMRNSDFSPNQNTWNTTIIVMKPVASNWKAYRHTKSANIELSFNNLFLHVYTQLLISYCWDNNLKVDEQFSIPKKKKNTAGLCFCSDQAFYFDIRSWEWELATLY